MENYGTNQQDSLKARPWFSLILIIIHYFIGIFVGQFVGVLLAMLLFGISYEQVLAIVGNFQEEPSSKYLMFCLQGGAAVGAFVVAPIYYLHRFEKKNLSSLFNRKSAHIIPILLTVFITISFMNVNSVFIEWNANLTLPEWLNWLEEVLVAQEEQAHELTEILTSFGSVTDFLIAFLVVAIIPAFGEELVFRGLVQRSFYSIFRNPHVAIWVAAFIFAALHFQFYGLVPRMFLGAIFGYLYYWSGSLLTAMIAHLINNGLSLIMFYLYQLGTIEEDVTSTPALPYGYILVFLLLGILGFWYYRRYFQQPIASVHE